MTTTETERDSALKNAVLSELSWTPSVNSTHIGVAVTDGAVTLAGEVDSYPEKFLAERAALRIRGVTALANEIEVRRPWNAPNDTDIARQVAQMLDGVVDVPDTVRATVHDHVVTLTGTVNWQYQREAAHRAVAYLKGVTSVINNIQIVPKATVANAKSAITAALVRNARLEAKNITVTAASNGIVKLTGTVNSWTERRQAEHAAWAAPGVVAVDNQLSVHS